MSRQQRDHLLQRAWLTGAISTRTYAWLWTSLWRYGEQWRLN